MGDGVTCKRLLDQAEKWQVVQAARWRIRPSSFELCLQER